MGISQGNDQTTPTDRPEVVITDESSGDYAKVGTKTDGSTKALHTIAEIVSGGDPISSGIVTIDSPHHETHEGNHYHYSQLFSLDESDIKEFIITVGATKFEHFLWKFSGRERTQIEFYENPTFTSGSSIVAINRNRNSANTYQGTLKEDPTVTVDGTLLEGHFTDGEETTRSQSEWVLKTNEDYLLRITSDKNNNDMSLAFNIYTEGTV